MSVIFLGGPHNGVVFALDPHTTFVEVNGYRYRRHQDFYIPQTVRRWRRGRFIQQQLADIAQRAYLKKVEELKQLRHPLAGTVVTSFNLQIDEDLGQEAIRFTAIAHQWGVGPFGQLLKPEENSFHIDQLLSQFELLARPADGEKKMVEDMVENMFARLGQKLARESGFAAKALASRQQNV